MSFSEGVSGTCDARADVSLDLIFWSDRLEILYSSFHNIYCGSRPRNSSSLHAEAFF
jgi:hypothetical protein